MPSLTVANAFDARLATWANISACPFVDLNEVSAVPSPPYIEMHYPVAVEERKSLGQPAIYRERGGVRFVITVALFRVGWKAEVLQWVEEIRDLFRSRQFDGVTTYEVSPPVFDDRNRDGNKYRVPFVVTYTRDTLR